MRYNPRESAKITAARNAERQKLEPAAQGSPSSSYLFPTISGSILLVVAVLLGVDGSSATWPVALIAVLLLIGGAIIRQLSISSFQRKNENAALRNEIKNLKNETGL